MKYFVTTKNDILYMCGKVERRPLQCWYNLIKHSKKISKAVLDASLAGYTHGKATQRSTKDEYVVWLHLRNCLFPTWCGARGVTRGKQESHLTGNQFPIKNFADWFYGVTFAETNYLNPNMCKSESLQSCESGAQSTDSPKTRSKPIAY